MEFQEEVVTKLDKILSLLTGETSGKPFENGITVAEASTRDDVENIDLKNKLVWFFKETPFGKQRWSIPLKP